MGWIRLHHKHASSPCICPYFNGSIFIASLRRLFNVLRYRDPSFDANSLRRIPTSTYFRTYGCIRHFRTHPTRRLHSSNSFTTSQQNLRFIVTCLPYRGLPTLVRSLSVPHAFGNNCSLDWKILFSLGHRLCENPYSYHCFGLRTSTYSMAILLLRSQLADLAIPWRSISLFPSSRR